MDWFEIYDGHSPRSYFHTVIQSWDTGMSGAPTADYSVGMTWGFRENYWYLLDIYRERLDYPDLKQAVIRKYKEWTPDKVLIEDAGAGKSLVQDLKIQGFSNLRQWRVMGGKEERFVGTFGEIETGHLLLPAEAPWLEAFKAELRAFPKGRHDDQVDAFSQFVEFQKWMWAYILEVPDERGRRIRPRLSKRPW